MEHLEGKESVIAALQAYQRRFEVILISHGSHEHKIRDLLELAERRAVPVRWVDRAELHALAHGSTHGGVLAIVSPKPRMTVAQLMDLLDTLREPPLLLLLEGVDDARNLGFTLRSAEAMGAHAVLIKKHLWDFDPIEVARPASGAYERLPLVQLDTVEPLEGFRKRGISIYGAIAGAKRTMLDVDLTGPTLICVGGEKRGLSGAVRSVCHRLVRIPTKGSPSSLSLSHAAAILLAETFRQRLAITSTGDSAALDDPPDHDLEQNNSTSDGGSSPQLTGEV